MNVDPIDGPAVERWSTLPGPAREQVLVLLARLIAREVLAVEEADR